VVTDEPTQQYSCIETELRLLALCDLLSDDFLDVERGGGSDD